MFHRKNKSFRPRDRPKRGLKNLQTVKTLTAGQNLTNATTVKTRKQPLTVTAQFQNSLTALMDTLNQVGVYQHHVIWESEFQILKYLLFLQANPFFIRCIKSNGQKIPNKFDDATVIRQVKTDEKHTKKSTQNDDIDYVDVFAVTIHRHARNGAHPPCRLQCQTDVRRIYPVI